eukprot:TRINITY_DN75173_c0_g1_i1.p1 TRINITY_DN75173_c0_g1~~TRINITY_DN75173_c0_g1_i1.p1  ORF type:complete len:308 (-),score=52.53 TRINITY_DN75173_c0_g1_i1:126-1049(-)
MFRTVCQCIYGTALVINMSSAALTMKILHLLPFKKKTLQGLSLMFAKFAWQVAFFFAPWMSITATAATAGEWKKIGEKMDAFEAEAKGSNEPCKPLFVLGNHTSFLDVILFSAKTPLRIFTKFRTYMDHNLFTLPILSTICISVGHFPVYFKTAEDGVFKVDNERMELVDQDVNEHLNSGGWLCFFPEGQVNKDPDTMLPFRFGGMKKALDFDARLVSFVAAGNQSAWPRKMKVGGFPARIKYSVKMLAPDGAKAFVADLRAQQDLPKEDQDMKDHELLAKHLRVRMQQDYDLLKQDLNSDHAVKSD